MHFLSRADSEVQEHRSITEQIGNCGKIRNAISNLQEKTKTDAVAATGRGGPVVAIGGAQASGAIAPAAAAIDTVLA